MTSIDRNRIFSQLAWDYNITADEIEDVLLNNQQSVAHYTRQALFKKILETYPWFTIIGILPVTDIKSLLGDDTIKQLRSKALRNHYAFIKERLQQTLSTAG